MRRAPLALVSALAAWLGGCDDSAAAPPGWRAGPPLPGPRLEAGVVALDGEVWVVGGFDGGLEVVTDTWRLPPGASAWLAGPPAPAPLSHLDLVVHDGRLFLLGGLRGRALTPDDRSWVLSGDRTTWEPRAPQPPGLARAAAAVISTADGVVLAGGADADGAVASALRYQPETDTWSRLPDLPGARSHPMGARDHAGRPLVLGGLAGLGADQPLADVLVLDDGGWRPRASMPTARGGAAVVELTDGLYLLGGERTGAVAAEIERYQPALDQWTSWPALPAARGGTGGAAWDGAAVMPGGAHRLAWAPVADVDVFQPTP